MTWPWLLVIGIAVVFVAALSVQGLLESDANPGNPSGPDEAHLALLGTESTDDEAPARRLRLVDLARRRIARIGRRPQP